MGTQDAQERSPDAQERSPDPQTRSQDAQKRSQDAQERSPEATEQQEERWSSVLREVHDESRDGRPWHVQVGEFLAWAGGIALGTDIVVLLALAIVALVSPKVPLNAMEMSNWLFWASCILLFGGLLAPTTTDLQDAANNRRKKSFRGGASATQRSSSRMRPSMEDRAPVASLETRRMQHIRKRLRRVYNPWRWRLWASAGISLLVTILVGSLA